MESSKVYVNVMAEFTNDGRLLPRSFIWKDGHVYEIQKVTDVRRAASLKAGGAGIRYTCIVDGKESHGKEHDQEKASRYSTDMEALRQRKRAM